VNTLAFGMPGGWEWIAIGLVMLLLFGSRLPSVARSIGDAMREFKKGVHDMSDDVKSPPREDRSYSAAKPPLTSGGKDERVGLHDPAEEPEPVRSERADS
jgi:sec-independent protein translocase protein TatA